MDVPMHAPRRTAFVDAARQKVQTQGHRSSIPCVAFEDSSVVRNRSLQSRSPIAGFVGRESYVDDTIRATRNELADTSAASPDWHQSGVRLKHQEAQAFVFDGRETGLPLPDDSSATDSAARIAIGKELRHGLGICG
jgi:hypothetical protein